MLGLLRLQLGRELELVDESLWKFLWVVDMPSAEWDEQEERWIAAHHPFTRPTDDSIEIFKTDPGAARAVAYDLVANGIELPAGRSGSTSRGSSSRSSTTSASAPEEQREKFGFLLDALAMGAPPHGGIASGIDRLTMALLNEPYIRDTQAFPKNQVGLRLHDRRADRPQRAAARRARAARRGRGRRLREPVAGAAAARGCCRRSRSSPAVVALAVTRDEVRL